MSSIDVRVEVDEDLLLVLQLAGSFFINFRGTLYTSYSEALYNELFGMTGVMRFSSDSIPEVNSITLVHKQKNGKIKTVEINETKTIEEITGLLSEAEYSPFDGYFKKVDVELTLHTDNGDIVCRLLSAPDEYQSEIFQINRLYCYQSQELSTTSAAC